MERVVTPKPKRGFIYVLDIDRLIAHQKQVATKSFMDKAILDALEVLKDRQENGEPQVRKDGGK